MTDTDDWITPAASPVDDWTSPVPPQGEDVLHSFVNSGNSPAGKQSYLQNVSDFQKKAGQGIVRNLGDLGRAMSLEPDPNDDGDALYEYAKSQEPGVLESVAGLAGNIVSAGALSPIKGALRPTAQEYAISRGKSPDVGDRADDDVTNLLAIATPAIKPSLATMSDNARITADDPPPPSPPGAGEVPTYPAEIRKYAAIKKANDTLSDVTSDAYQKAKDIGAVFTPGASQVAVDTMQSTVGDKLDPGLHRQTIGALNLFYKKAAAGLNLEAIENTRKQLGNIAYDSNADANDIGAAKQAIKQINNIYDNVKNDPSMLVNGAPESVEALEEGRAASALERRHATVAQIVRKANGDANKLQSGFKKLHDDEDEYNQYAPETQSLIYNMAHPGAMDKVLRGVGNLGFGGSSKTIPAVEATAAVFGQPLAVAPIALGTTANLLRNRLIRGGAEKILQNLENQSVKPKAYDTYQQNLQQQTDSASEMQPMNYAPKLPQSSPSYFPNESDINPDAPMVSSLSPKERLAAQSDVMQSAAKRNTPMRDQRNIAMAQLQNMADSPKTAPIKNLSDIGPQNLSDILAREHATGIQEEIQQLRNMGMSEQEISARYPGYKKGGRVNTNLSDAQKHAGNYKKEHMIWNGLGISIENSKGSYRKGIDKNGKQWRVRMPVPYGYFKRSHGADGDHVDVFVGPRLKSEKVFVINQQHADTKKFDEHKVMIGFPAKGHALAAYRKSFSDGKADNRIKSIVECSIPELRAWLSKTHEKKVT